MKVAEYLETDLLIEQQSKSSTLFYMQH